MMIRLRPSLVLSGVIPANLLPFTPDLEIDGKNYRKHLRYLVNTEGVNGITINGHAAEVATLNFEEQQYCLNVAIDEVSGKVPVIFGVYSDGTQNAIRLAKMAEKENANCQIGRAHV